ncbi:MAG: peptidylprolyl isomerase [Acidobacteria bacterium]|nr:peptidylprolyl isomerase [Acidobacteriota bacterium]
MHPGAYTLTLLSLTLAAQHPDMGPKVLIHSEWARQSSALISLRIPTKEQPRLDLALARIGAPGAPALLPLELDHPTKDVWEGLARKAKSPQDRFTALYFLNRFKAADALVALEGLGASDAKTWPGHLHLEGQIATARLNGSEVSEALQGFLDALKAEGKVDPVRAQAAQLRLVMAGKEKALFLPVKATAGAVLSLMDSFNRSPAPVRAAMLKAAGSDPLNLLPALGCAPSKDAALRTLIVQRLTEGAAEGVPAAWILAEVNSPTPSIRQSVLGYLGKLGPVAVDAAMAPQASPVFQASVLPSLRALAPIEADALRAKLLAGPSSVARAAAIDDLPAAPADLEALAKRCYADSNLESALELYAAMDRWKVPVDRQKEILTRFLHHPDWGWRYQAYLQLKKVDPATPWPSAPAVRPGDKTLLDEAIRLAKRGRPVRLRLTFSGKRVVTLKLDPRIAPMNVANLVLLAKKRFFDGHRVPRIVPDFVVQMGSPLDTMDGGPGYSVRCEDSTTWYGPGSVGMALAGKDTGGCQFFITTNATPHLTGKYTRVGEVANPDHDLKVLDDLELGAKIESVRVVD